MAARQAPGRPRMTEEQIAEIQRLKRQGLSIKEIAQATGYHRQTVSAYLKERRADALADEVRKQVLVEELRWHFRDLAEHVPEMLRRRLDASRSQEGSSWPGTSISTAGVLGLPAGGPSTHVVEEWVRMYARPQKDRHLVQALREHTRSSELWDHLDKWEKEVDGYQRAGGKIFSWIVERTEAERWKLIDPEHIDSVRRWLFGNLMRKAAGGEYEALEFSGQELTSPGLKAPVARGADRDKLAALRDWLKRLLEEAEGLREWAELKAATEKMLEKQKRLMGIAERIDAAIGGVSLMRAFPGRCHLCPV